MNELKVFSNEEFGNVRVVELNGKEMFVAKDIASALGYTIPSKAVNTHCKGVSKMEVPTNGGIQEMLMIPEGDVYRLIVKSKLPSAEKFESWVFDEVLPTIRKTGGYIPTKEDDTPKELMARALIVAQKTLELKNERIKTLENKLEEVKPMVAFAETIEGSSDSIDMGDMAKLCSKAGLKIGRNRLFELLRKNKILMNDNVPYQKYIENGWFEVTEVTKNTPYGIKTFVKTLVSGRGQIRIVELVRSTY